MSQPIIQSLRELDAELQQQRLSAEADARILSAMRTQKQKQHAIVWYKRPALAWVACVMFVVGGFTQWISNPEHVEVQGGLQILRGTVSTSQDTLHCTTSSCALRFVERDVQIRTEQGSSIRRVHEDIQWKRGKAEFKVAHQTDARRPFRVFVSGGYIEVLGTRFTVWQGQHKGRVVLHEGTIRFVYTQGPTRLLRRQGTLHWPWRETKKLRSRPVHKVHSKKGHHRVTVRAVKRTRTRRTRPVVSIHRVQRRHIVRRQAIARKRTQVTQAIRPILIQPRIHNPSKIHASKPPVRRAVPKLHTIPSHWKRSSIQPTILLRLAAFLDDIERLRAQGRFMRAARHLRMQLKKMKHPSYRVIRERFHYELGLLLTHYAGSAPDACKHWQEHQRLFASSHRYRHEIDTFLRRLRCSAAQ